MKKGPEAVSGPFFVILVRSHYLIEVEQIIPQNTIINSKGRYVTESDHE